MLQPLRVVLEKKVPPFASIAIGTFFCHLKTSSLSRVQGNMLIYLWIEHDNWDQCYRERMRMCTLTLRAFSGLQWWQLLLQQGPFYEAKVPNSDG